MTGMGQVHQGLCHSAEAGWCSCFAWGSIMFEEWGGTTRAQLFWDGKKRTPKQNL